jgi:hypothetical protein
VYSEFGLAQWRLAELPDLSKRASIPKFCVAEGRTLPATAAHYSFVPAGRSPASPLSSKRSISQHHLIESSWTRDDLSQAPGVYEYSYTTQGMHRKLRRRPRRRLPAYAFFLQQQAWLSLLLSHLLLLHDLAVKHEKGLCFDGT